MRQKPRDCLLILNLHGTTIITASRTSTKTNVYEWKNVCAVWFWCVLVHLATGDLARGLQFQEVTLVDFSSFYGSFISMKNIYGERAIVSLQDATKMFCWRL